MCSLRRLLTWASEEEMQTMEQYNHRWTAVEDEESKKNSKTKSDLKNLLRDRLWRRGGRTVNSRTSDQ